MDRPDISAIERAPSAASVSSQSTHYSFDECTEEMFIEVDRAESLFGSQLSQTANPLKRKREDLFDITDADNASETPSPTPKILKTETSRATASSSSSVQEDNRSPIMIPTGSLAATQFLANMPIGFLWELARILVLLNLSIDKLNLDTVQSYRDSSNKTAGPAVIEHSKDLFKDLKIELQTADSQFAAAFTQEKAAQSPWEELDKEEKVEQRLRSTRGSHDVYLHEEGWYGGRVHFTGKLKQIKGQTSYKLELDRPYLGSSNRLTRRFGSKRVIRIKYDRKLARSGGLMEYFRQPFIVFGRVFRAFFAKEGRVFLFQTNEVAQAVYSDSQQRIICQSPSSSTSGHPLLDISFLDFVQWHNPLELNREQAMSKWASRFALGLSNSVPGVDVKDLCQIPDIVCGKTSGKIPAECIMTDGSGFANANLFHLLQEQFRWDSFPTAIQMRIEGAKGLLVLHPEHTTVTPDREPRVWLRPSQLKITYPPTSSYDRARHTVDVVRSSHMSSPSSLSVETIINLSENGVNALTLSKMLKVALAEKVDGLTKWDGPDGLSRLWYNILREGHVISARLARQEAGAARAKGYIYEDDTDDWEDGDPDLIDKDGVQRVLRAAGEQSVAWWEDPVSGQPSSLEETCLVLLDSGFSPASNPVLASKLMHVAKKSVRSFTTKYHITVPMSCSAFVIPDPCNVLQPGEVYIKSSRRNLMNAKGTFTDSVVGDVLLTRHPCKVPSDVQKAKAVLKDELRDYVDVIIVSTKGHIVNGETLDQHLASMTGGGDYDGDLMSAYWQPDLLNEFKPADKKFATPPDTLSACIKKSSETVDTFLSRHGRKPSISGLQTYLLGELENASVVGIYSTFWQRSLYANGYSHPETIRLAYIFCAVLDATKTGVSIDQTRYNEDLKTYNKYAPPQWEDPIVLDIYEKSRNRFDTSNNKTLKRAAGLPIFVMDVIKAEIQKECFSQLRIIKERLSKMMRLDEDLARPWREFEGKAKAAFKDGRTYMMGVRDAIEAHVKTICEEWVKERHADLQDSRNKGKGRQIGQHADKTVSSDFTNLPIELRQDKLRQWSQRFACHPKFEPEYLSDIYDDTVLSRLKASCAYCLSDQNSACERFPYDVATRALCDIKAHAVSNGTAKTVTPLFYARFVLDKRFFESK